MRKVVRLTETDLKKIVKRVLSESDGENLSSKKEKKPRIFLSLGTTLYRLAPDKKPIQPERRG